MRAYRLAKAQYAALDGEGARLNGGRWNSQGVAMVYLASSAAPAMLELLVHLDPGMLPSGMVLITVEIPDDIEREILEPLPDDWNHNQPPAECRIAGDAWAHSARSAVLIVPSVIVPKEYNVLLNPVHRDSRRIEIIEMGPFPFDPRFFRTDNR